MATAKGLVAAALRKVGALEAGEPLAPSDTADGVEALNTLIDGWRNEDLLTFVDARYIHRLTGGVASYVVGPGHRCRCVNRGLAVGNDGTTIELELFEPPTVTVGSEVLIYGLTLTGTPSPTPAQEPAVRWTVTAIGDDSFTARAPSGVTIESIPAGARLSFVAARPGQLYQTRPVWLRAASVIVADVEYPIQIIDSAEGWQSISVKTIATNYPSYLWFQAGIDEQDAIQIQLYPVPAGSHTLVLYTPRSIEQFSNPDDEFMLPPGYERALVFNLAMDLAPEYGMGVPQAVAIAARDAKRVIKRVNERTPVLESELAGVVGVGSDRAGFERGFFR